MSPLRRGRFTLTHASWVGQAQGKCNASGSIEDALAQGRRRISLGVRELAERAGVGLMVHPGVLADECRPLYDRAVRAEVARIRDATTDGLGRHAEVLAAKRLAWCDEHPEALPAPGLDPLQAGYDLLLRKLDIDPADAPIVERDAHRIVFHSRNFCPTLEACRILGEDTTRVCRALTEMPAAVLVARADPRLRFSRNYSRIRPASDACEELINLER